MQYIMSLVREHLDKSVQEAQERVIGLVRDVEIARDFINKVGLNFPSRPGDRFSVFASSIFIRMPRVQSRINRVVKILESKKNAGKLDYFINDTSSSDGSITYKVMSPKRDCNIYLIFDASMGGSTCELVKIGEEQRSYTAPVYEVICQEGAKEQGLREE